MINEEDIGVTDALEDDKKRRQRYSLEFKNDVIKHVQEHKNQSETGRFLTLTDVLFVNGLRKKKRSKKLHLKDEDLGLRQKPLCLDFLKWRKSF